MAPLRAALSWLANPLAAIWMLAVALLYVARWLPFNVLPVVVVVASLVVGAGIAFQTGLPRRWRLAGAGVYSVGLIAAITAHPIDRLQQVGDFARGVRAGTAPDGDVVAAVAVGTALAVGVAWTALELGPATLRCPRGLLLAPALIAVGVIVWAAGAIQSILPALGVLLGAFPIGRWVLQLIRADADDDLLGWLVSCCVGCGVISLTWGALGSIGLFSSLSLTLAFLGLLALAWRAVRRLALRSVRAGRWLITPTDLRHKGLELALGAIISGLTCMMLIAALAPDLGADAIANHLVVATGLARRGSLQPAPYSIITAYWYVPVQVLYAAMIAWSGPIAAKLLHFGFGVMTVLSSALLAVHLTGRREAGLVAAACLAASNLVWGLAGTAYVDLTIAFYFVATVSALIRWLQVGQQRWLVIGGLCAGFAVPAKLTSIVLAGVLALAVVLRERGDPRRLSQSLFLCGIPALLMILPWAVRSYVLTGNPVFPWLNQVFRSPLVEPVAAYGGAGPVWGDGSDLAALLRLPVAITFAPDHFVETGELGVQWLALCPLLLWLLWRSRPTPVRLFLAGSVALFGIFWLLYLHQNLRYLFPIVPLWAVGLGVAYSQAARARRSWFLAPALVAVLFLAIIGSALNPNTWWLRGVSASGLPYRVVFGHQAASSYLATYVQGYSSMQYLNMAYRGNAQIWSPSFSNRLYSEAPIITNDVYAVLSTREIAQNFEQEREPGALFEKLRTLGFSHMVLNAGEPAWSGPLVDRPAYLRPDFLEQFAALEYADHGILVYRLLQAKRDAAPPAGPELLPSTHFEGSADGGVDFWVSLGSPLRDPAGSLAGTRGPAVAVDGANSLLSGVLDIVPGATYRLVVSARSSEPQQKGWFQVQFLSNDGRVPPEGWAPVPYYPDGTSREYVVYATAPMTARRARLRLGAERPGRWVWIDTVSLTRVSDN